MDKYEIKIIGPNKEDMNAIESLRKRVFHIKPDTFNRYEYHIVHGKIIPFGLYIKGELVAGCYIGSGFDSLYVYYLFVKEEYRNTGLRLGRNLLGYVLEHKYIVETLLDETFTESSLHPINDRNREIYKKLGYQNGKNGIMTIKI